ncbi:MAG: DUF1559 domain-containing protein [Planctomycetaceae bacterium]|nr:DUF1559 domain-containing protein [Planctomycetaceae bacterium]
MPRLPFLLWLGLVIHFFPGCGPAEEKPDAINNSDSTQVTANETLLIEESQMGPIGDGKVADISDGGEVQIDGWDEHSTEIDKQKNYFVIFRERQGNESYLTTGRFTQLPHGDRTKLKLNQGAEKLTTDHVLLIFRPSQVSDEFVDHFLATIPLEDPTPSRPDEGEQTLEDARKAALFEHSRNNLRQIVLAMHNYAAEHGCLPPGILVGPDGKPWHSWRTLLLPYLDQRTVYDLYDVTRPWDSSANKTVQEIGIPEFSDPVYDELESHHTAYGVAIGDHTPFRKVEFDGTKEGFKAALKQGGTFAQISDGTSNTILVATISPEAKINWTEPRDVLLDGEAPPLNSAGGFATPYSQNQSQVLLAAMGDGQVVSYTAEKLNEGRLESLLTSDGQEPLVSDEQPTSRPKVILELKSNGAESSAKFKVE